MNRVGNRDLLQFCNQIFSIFTLQIRCLSFAKTVYQESFDNFKFSRIKEYNIYIYAWFFLEEFFFAYLNFAYEL